MARVRSVMTTIRTVLPKTLGASAGVWIRLTLVLWIACTAGCSGDSQLGNSTSEEMDLGAEDVAPEVSPFTPCEDNTECLGGEICRGGNCREACAHDDPCSGVFEACALDRSYCVECVDETHCGRNQECRENRCVFSCAGDAACQDGFHCDSGSGRCVEDECETDEECGGGFRCLRMVCVPIDAIVCQADSRWCDGNVLVTCSRDGTSESRDACDEQVCVTSDDGARCADVICTPNEIGCSDRETAFLCDGTGTVQTDSTCAEGRYCADGTCRDEACEPQSQICDGDVLLSCNEEGTSTTATRCAELSECSESAFGCSCVERSCELRTCSPGSARCVGESRQECTRDGLTYLEPVDCGDDEVCIAGTCQPESCEPAAVLCAGDVLVECDGDGNGYSQMDCTDTTEICVQLDDSAECQSRVCEPDSAVCIPSATGLATCDYRGTFATTRVCDVEEYCSNGACVPDVCAHESGNQCVDGDVQQCNALGSGFELVEQCDEATEACRAGACEPRE